MYGIFFFSKKNFVYIKLLCVKIEIVSNIISHHDVKNMNKRDLILNYEQKIKELTYTIEDM